MTGATGVALGTTAAQLQQMLDAAEPGAVFYLAQGTYRFDQTVVISTSNVALIGAGSGRTIIKADASLGDAPVLQLGHALHSPEITGRTELAAPAAADNNAVSLTAGHGVEVGDYLYFKQANTDAWLDEIGDTLWRDDKELRVNLVEVTGVNGQRVSFENTLGFDYDPAITSIEIREMVENNTISGITITGPHGQADASDFSNTQRDTRGASEVMIGGAAQATIEDLQILDARSHGITFAGSRDVTMTGFELEGSHNKGGGGNGYAVWIRDLFDSDLHAGSITDARHAILFGAFNTASGNEVQVDFTNRDINLHGGADHDNTITVDQMIRDADEQRYLSTATFINPGTSYGAPTDPDANDITFRHLVGSNKDDEVIAHDDGANLFLVFGEDIAHTGAGDDYVHGGKEEDTIYASEGTDVIIGGEDDDLAVFDAAFATYSLGVQDDWLIVSGHNGRTWLSEVESVSFADQSFDIGVLMTQAPGDAAATLPDLPEPFPGEEIPIGTEDGPNWGQITTAGLRIVDGSPRWDRYTASDSFVLGERMEASGFDGSADLIAIGNDLGNNMLGNAGGNRLEGRAGDDRLFGRGGDDMLNGGNGADMIDAGSGDDSLIGGGGDDTLAGGSGDDTFRVSGGRDRMDGGSGDDLLLLLRDFDSFEFTVSGDAIHLTHDDFEVTVEGIETFAFADRTLSLGDLPAGDGDGAPSSQSAGAAPATALPPTGAAAGFPDFFDFAPSDVPIPLFAGDPWG